MQCVIFALFICLFKTFSITLQPNSFHNYWKEFKNIKRNDTEV